MTFLAPEQLPETNHLWIWLNEPQHSAAVQAILGIFTTVAAIVAAIAALMAYWKTVEQVSIANAQLGSARKQANAAQRPFLVVEHELMKDHPEIKEKILIIHNNGQGPVTNSFWVRESELKKARVENGNPKWARIGSISVKGKAALPVVGTERFASNIESGIWIHYSDLEGNVYFCWCTDTRLGPNCDNDILSDPTSSPIRLMANENAQT
jgi:hypothetical protein